MSELLKACDAYITALRQRVYGRSDGSRPTDDDLNALGSACIPQLEAVLRPPAERAAADAATPRCPHCDGPTRRVEQHFFGYRYVTILFACDACGTAETSVSAALRLEESR